MFGFSRWLLLTLVSLSTMSHGLEVPKASLKALDTQYASIAAADERSGMAMLFEVRVLPGDDFSLRLPFSPNRFTPLLKQGSRVAEGQAMARVSGPELTAWLLHARATEARFAAAESRFRKNQTLYEQQALSASKWTEIADRFYALQEEMHHVEHTLEILDVEDGSLDSVATVVAPRAGQVLFADFDAQLAGEIEVARISEAGTQRLTALLPQSQNKSPVKVRVGDCDVPISYLEARVEGFSRRVWSDPLPSCLHAPSGSLVDAQLRFAFDGFSVPRESLISVDGQTAVFVDRGTTLELVLVHVASSDGSRFYVRSEQPIGGQKVLVSSVSAVQGILLGLGTD